MIWKGTISRNVYPRRKPFITGATNAVCEILSSSLTELEEQSGASGVLWEIRGVQVCIDLIRGEDWGTRARDPILLIGWRRGHREGQNLKSWWRQGRTGGVIAREGSGEYVG